MADTIHTYIIKNGEDMKVSLKDWLVGEYCLTIGTKNEVKIIGDLKALNQIAVMAETLIEIEGMRLRKDAARGDFQEEKKRAESK